ncbi:hypothetical protein BDM02DRAFT_3193505 [Thelephora ganbajun]|uniref:Uncharacterized protein n=1 Tax=Thelephora ganbajun TaxID=370292 RepID=A0ACB6YYF5_THEGA|nr:hypothetical protein BDM02DRAFT_3193505 [Thelephora ganbajun]
MSLHRSHIARHAALGSTVDPLHGLISLGLVDWDGCNQVADSAIDGIRLAATLAEWLLTLHEGVALEAQMLASSLDLVTVAHNERLGRLESHCFEQEQELGEMRVRMLELELAWERQEFQVSSGYASAVGEEAALVEEGMEEGRVEEEELMEGEDGLWSPNSSDRAVLALMPDSFVFPTQ